MEPDTLGWTFYEKPISSSRVLRASSAFNWCSKLVTMHMECFRNIMRLQELRNIMRQATVDTRARVLNKFVEKLRLTGYIEKSVEGIITYGVGFHKRKVRIELDGGPAVNARDDRKTIQRRRQKLGVMENLFARRRGGLQGKPAEGQQLEVETGLHQAQQAWSVTTLLYFCWFIP